MDDWDAEKAGPKLIGTDIPHCDFTPRPAVHRIGGMHYISFFRRGKDGIPFADIKQSEEAAAKMAEACVSYLSSLIRDFSGWVLVTTPRRRHADCFHLATEVCNRISSALGAPFVDGAVQCYNHDRLHPEFHLLRPFTERKVILFDDIITTGATMTATWRLLSDREIVLNLIGISNR